MKLRSLHIHGFKSFADATVIDFHEGITAVVGPNGCGKSNISDAIRWVLGEQRPTAIRGGKMEEAIFQGSLNRRPVNRGSVTAQLISRHWYITDAEDRTEEVEGEGVVGEQPILKPGEGFRYTSGAVIETPVGTMHGTYQMIAEDGREFDATIPRFVLSAPRTLH